MLRISAFAFMYTLPTVVNTACIAYEAFMMESWLTNWLAIRCARPDRAAFGFSQPRNTCISQENIRPPDLLIYFFKYLMQLVVGITCAVWVCSSKTLNSYSQAYARLVHGRSQVPTRVHEWFGNISLLLFFSHILSSPSICHLITSYFSMTYIILFLFFYKKLIYVRNLI